ncbi:hypothetical protein ACFLS1_08530, partial [Verrucomicrobiota bacterium]
LAGTIIDLNKRKAELRRKLAEIEKLKAEIEDLKGQIRTLRVEIEELKSEIETIKEEKAELQSQNALLEEKNDELELRISKLNREVEQYKGGAMTAGPGGGAAAAPVALVTPGVKGKVVTVEPDWNFVVIELNEEFITEVLGDEPTDKFTGLDLFVKRSGPDKSEIFVTKIRLLQIKSDEKLGVADILSSWQQLPVNKGDIVWF